MKYLEIGRGVGLIADIELDDKTYYAVAVFPSGGNHYRLEYLIELDTEEVMDYSCDEWGKIQTFINEQEDKE